MAAFAQPSRPASAAQPHPSSSPPAPHSAAITAVSRHLPSGPCNWRDLNLGRHGNTCGCRQFWLNDVALLSDGRLDQRSPDATSGAWCFCGHHACFHKLRGDTSLNEFGPAERQEKDDGWGLPENFCLELNQAANPEYVGQPVLACPPAPQYIQEPSKQHNPNNSGLGLSMPGNAPQIQQTHPSSLPRPSLLNYAGYLPSTQSSPKPLSRSTPEAGNHPRYSPNAAFSNYVASQRRPVPQVDVRNLPPPSHHHEDAAQSATEVATPSNAGTPALRETDDAFNAVRTTLDAFNRNDLAGSSVSAPPNVGAPLTSRHECETNPSPENSNIAVESSHRADLGGKAAATSPQLSNIAPLNHLMAQITSLKALLSTTPNIRTSLLSLNNRVEALETASFSHVPVEELQEKFEYFDGRLLDVEGKIDVLEKVQAAEADDQMRTRKKAKANESFGSNASSSDVESVKSGSRYDLMEENRINYSAALSRLSKLEQRLVNLEATALPTRANPWEIEVVWIPWGRKLSGVWATALEASQSSKLETQGSGTTRSSPQIPNSICNIPDGSTTGAAAEWNNGSQEWLSPRACGPTNGVAGRIYQRLKSRGYVRNIEIRANSAAKVESEICSAFSELLLCAENKSGSDVKADKPEKSYLGLRASLIPLRKVHKSSRLRHLAHSELITPSLWTAEFLNSSVFMQTPTTGQRRLFVTTPAAYAQSASFGDGWTWQTLRELPRVDPPTEHNETTSKVVGEADANEPCWAWDARLDPPISVHSSFSSGISYHSSLGSRPLSPQQTNDDKSDVASGCSDMEAHEPAAAEGGKTNKLARPRSPITPVSEYPLSRQPQHVRTASMPLTEPQASLANFVPKRQIASFEHCSPAKSITKRRRFSREADDVELMAMWNLTPRRSREPPSPGGPSSARTAEGMQPSSSKGKLTPQPYATPFSNNVAMVEDVKGDEGTWVFEDADDDSEGENSSNDADDDDDDDDENASVDMNDEAWEGVVEDDHPREHIEAVEHFDGDEDDDEEDELAR